MIPSVAHFIWFGRELPWAHVLAVRSALAAGGFERAVLHHADPLEGTRWWGELASLEGFEARRLDPAALLAGAGPRGGELAALFGRLKQPAAKANMVRAALLAREGGVYLDLDTITVGSLEGLRAAGGVFCGEEHVALPGAVRQGRNPLKWARAGVQLGVRDVFRRLPGGWLPRAVNNAVIGAEAGHPFLWALLTRMVELDPAKQVVRFALGTHLLQEAVEASRWGDVRVLPPAVFYPLGPEISEHWFRVVPEVRLEEVLLPETRVVHWYASVRTAAVVPQLDPDYVRAHAGSQLFAALASRFVEAA
jgi:hypothetical protein